MPGIIRYCAFFAALLFLFSCDPNAGKTEYRLDATISITPGKDGERCFTEARNEIVKRFTDMGVTENNIIIERNGSQVNITVLGVYSTPKEVSYLRNYFVFPESFQTWETYDVMEVLPGLLECEKLAGGNKGDESGAVGTTVTDSVPESFSLKAGDDTPLQIEQESEEPVVMLGGLLPPIDRSSGQVIPGPVIGYSYVTDTAKIMARIMEIRRDSLVPSSLVLMWGKHTGHDDSLLALFSLKRSTVEHPHAMDGTGVENSEVIKSEWGGWEVHYTYNDANAVKWQNLTKRNIGRSIAIVMADYVYMAPTVQAEITGGQSVITGDFSKEEAEALSVILRSKPLNGSSRVLRYSWTPAGTH